jgi:ParB-like chromosome segregation protein Spo0J
MSQGMQILWRNPNELRPHEGNARVHSEDQVNQIAASITEFGFNQPVLLDGDGGIIAGHGRVRAALVLGLDSIPTIDLSHLDEVSKRAYIIADNKIALNSEWDATALASELDKLNSDDVDLALLGFSIDELASISEGDMGRQVDPVDQDQPQKINFTIQFNVIFDDEEQQSDWYSLVKYLKDQYPEAETLGQRLQLFIRANGYGTN